MSTERPDKHHIVNGKGRTIEDVFDLVDQIRGVVRLTGAILFVLLVGTAGLIWQISTRNNDLDDTAEDVDIIRGVAERIEANPGPGEAVALGLTRIGEMLVLMCEEDQHRDDPICVGG